MKFVTALDRIFYNVHTREFLWVNNILAALTLISVFSIILETVPELSAYTSFFAGIEYITVIFFTAEYIGRIIAKRQQVGSYIFSFFGIIDLLSILPTYFGLTNLTFLKTARVLRILRLLRIVRLAKVARIVAHKRRDIEEYGHLYRLNLHIYFAALAAAVIIFGTLIFIFESDQPTFASIPLGMLWALKPLLGGVAQELPATIAGEIVAVTARFVGLVLFGLLIAVIGNAARKLLLGTETAEVPSK